MKRKLAASGGAFLASAALAMFFSSATVSTQAPPANAPRMSAAEFEQLFKTNNNWGRWGKNDKLGTMNLITNAKRKQAAALVKSGIAVSIAHDLSSEAALDNPNPMKLAMGPNFRTDVQTFNYHGPFVTHLDSLCHYPYNGRLYNDIPVTANNENGCAIGIENLKDGIVTRGVLIDIPRLKGVPYLEPPTPVTPEEVDAWLKKTGLKVTPGDAIVLRTGRWARRATVGPWRALGNAAGFTGAMVPWLKSHDVALVGGDTTADIQSEPRLIDGEAGRMPIHTAIAWLGMNLIDDVDPEALAETAARLNRWEFMMVVAPLRVPGATGGPVNPIAIF